MKRRRNDSYEYKVPGQAVVLARSRLRLVQHRVLRISYFQSIPEANAMKSPCTPLIRTRVISQEYDHDERLPQVAYCPVFWPCSTSLLFLIRYSPRTFSGFCGLEHMAHRQSTCTLVHPSELCETYCSLAISFNPSSRYGVIFSFKYIRAGAPPATLGRTLSSPEGFPPVVVDELWVSAELPMGVVLELIVVVFGRCEGEEVRKGYCVARVLSGIWRCLCRRSELLELGLF